MAKITYKRYQLGLRIILELNIIIKYYQSLNIIIIIK